MKSFANALLVSSRAAAWVGPNTRRPSASKRSARPAASGASGPTTVKSIRSLIDEPNHGDGVQYVDRGGGDGSGDAGVAGSANDVSDAGFGKEFGGEGVLARAGAENEDPHGL